MISSTLEMYQEPLTGTFEDVESDELEVYFALGIVNPRGPTLTYVAAVGSPRLGVPRPIVHVMLNPFSQVIKQVGRLTIGNDYKPEILKPLYGLDFGSCPSLILLSSNATDDQDRRIATEIFSGFQLENVATICQCIANHFADPATRIQEILNGHLPTINEVDESCVSRLVELAMKPEHIWPEIQAMTFAWNGSIELSGISDSLKNRAFSATKYKKHLIEQLMPSLWIPEPPKVGEPVPPPVKNPARYIANTTEELRETLQRENWDDFEIDQLADLLTSAILLYGLQVNTHDIPHISRLYQYGLNRGLDVDTRTMIEATAFDYVEKKGISPAVFLPFLVHDSDPAVVSKALIDFVSESPYVDGELYAVSELRSLFNGNLLANRGAVFGALIALGDIEVEPLLESIKPSLSVENVRTAARVHTAFLKKFSIAYWIKWANELCPKGDNDSLAKFGACATAISLCLRYDQTGKVVEAKRNFPCSKTQEPITFLKTWSLPEFAELIAPELYALESAESPPRVFSDVLRSWGLKPNAPLEEQFIPEEGSTNDGLKPLRDLSR